MACAVHLWIFTLLVVIMRGSLVTPRIIGCAWWLPSSVLVLTGLVGFVPVFLFLPLSLLLILRLLSCGLRVLWLMVCRWLVLYLAAQSVLLPLAYLVPMPLHVLVLMGEVLVYGLLHYYLAVYFTGRLSHGHWSGVGR